MIIGTAGHIDHGKSALVTALTGRPMDRLAEEQRRGITIDLNFAPLHFAGLPPAGIVDVPGHEDFVRTMVAGASGIDLVLLVVDAAQGPQPQTWEHLSVVEQLAVPRGIPVITKADLAEPEWLELVVDELMARLQRSPVAFGPPAIVSAVSGQGIAELAERLRAHAAEPVAPQPEDGFRMPIDRAFSIAGTGTVVTGTPWSGTLRLGDTVDLLPSGLSARVRSLEAYGAPVTQAHPGTRTAVGLAGIERAALHRGEVLLDRRIPWKTTTALDALIELLPESPPLRRQLRLRVHLGTAEVLARAYPRNEIAGGESGLVRLALEEPIVARGNDRFVLRSYSPVRTIGGGRVLDPLPPRRATWPEGLQSRDAGARLVALVARRRGGIPLAEVPLLLGTPGPLESLVEACRGQLRQLGGHLVPTQIVEELRARAVALVQGFHREHPRDPGLSLETLRRGLEGPPEVVSTVLAAMVRDGDLKGSDGLVAAPGFTPQSAGNEALLAKLLGILEEAGLTPPTVSELETTLGARGLLPLLRQAALEKRVTAVEGDRYFSAAALKLFLDTIRQLAAEQAITPSHLRERLGLSRKYLIPLLEWSDRSGITRRVGDTRVLV